MLFSIGTFKGCVNNCRNILAPLKPQVMQFNGRVQYVPAGLATDTIQLSSKGCNFINKQLKNLYNIDSNIKDPKLAQKTFDAVEDFCKLNKKDKMFAGLKLTSEAMDDAACSGYAKFDTTKKEFNICFNENFNWKELEKITEEAYNNGKIAANNPKYFLYKHLGEYLNFKYNPSSYKITADREFVNITADKARKISDSTNINEFNSNYIAARMSKKQLPKTMRTFFEEQNGNVDLKFPKPIPETFNSGSTHKFKSMDDAKDYLSKNYGIQADLETLTQANMLAGSADDITKLLGSKKYFQGLQIKTDINKFDDTATKASLCWNHSTGDAILYLNPAYNWKNNAKLMLKDYEAGLHPSANPKDIFTHELCHWLDFNGNPLKFGQKEIAFKRGETIYNDFGKSITGKVSAYAAQSPAEFCAEYICGRLNGIKYPESTNKEFLLSWNGPKLNFID